MPERSSESRAEDWALPGTRISRRARIYWAGAKTGARYLRLKTARTPEERAGVKERADRLGASDLYRAAVHLRGGFLKAGQFASARPDLLPDPYVRELSRLQDRVPPAPAGAIRKIVESEIGPIEDHFSYFDTESASAASLAQVHRAVRRDGREVAVKVQYPRVADIVPTEARDTTRILKLVDRFAKGIDLTTIAEELERVILDEINYSQEATNIERFAKNFAGEIQIEVPGVHHDLTSGRVLVMDWVSGENLARAIETAPPDVAEEAARILADSYLKQILIDGFLHADPHPGNFLLQDPLRLGFVDFGACAELSEETRLNMGSLYRAAIEDDIKGAAEALHALGFRTRSGDSSGLIAFVSLFNFEGDEGGPEENWSRLVAASRANPLVKLPPELIMVGRVLIVQTGLVARLKPKWDMAELVSARLDQLRDEP